MVLISMEKKKELLEILARRGEENDNRFHDLVKRLVSKYGGGCH